MVFELRIIRRFLIGSATALALTLAVAPTRGATAQQLPTAMVAVVDVQLIMQESVAAKSIHKQLDAQRQTYQKEIAKQEDKLRGAEQELGRQRADLPPDAFEQKRREFEQQVAEVQRSVQTRKRVLDQAFNESMKKLHDGMLQVVAEVAGEQKASLVLAKQQVVLAEKSLDLTNPVLERLNKKMPTVAVTVPKS
jgi:Skp family chaperone for outer membrane proteins